MIEILQSPQHLASASSSITTFVVGDNNDGLHQHTNHNIDNNLISGSPSFCPVAAYRGGRNTEIIQEVEEEGEIGFGGFDFGGRDRKKREREEGEGELSLLTVLVTVFRKSLIACSSIEGEEQLSSSSSSDMEISWPTNVRHVAHVTFDRFNGFLGLPVEFEPEVPRRPPSASTRVFGVSTESMQLSFDCRGNSVPTILLMMQRRLYARGGLQAEGIFRINAENGQEVSVREQLNRGIVPEDVDVHCLAGLIKAWFRELPTGLLDALPPDHVMQAQSEEECSHLVRLLPPTEAALLDWAINLMADIAQFEHLNKMNARNIATVFAPNMTQMADPLTALMFAVQVMNFLKTLIEKTMREREDSILDVTHAHNLEPFDENGHRGASQSITHEEESEGSQDEDDDVLVAKWFSSSTIDHQNEEDSKLGDKIESICPDEKENIVDLSYAGITKDGYENRNIMDASGRFESKTGQSSNSNLKKESKNTVERPVIHVSENAEKGKEISIISCLNSLIERAEAWI